MVLGVDIGATKTRVACLRGGSLIRSDKIGTREDHRAFLKDLENLIDRFLEREPGGLEAIGVGAPGPLDLRRGVFRRLPNLPTWDGFDIKGELEKTYRVPVRVQNDANAAALGEAIHGAGKGYPVVYYVTISTGIGGGIVIGGRILDGRNDLAGEIWALPVMNLGEEDILINSSSGPGIVRNAKKLLAKGQQSILEEGGNFDTAEVFECARKGDPVALSVTETAVENMAYALNAILVALDPDVVLVGGGLAADERNMIDPIKRLLGRKAYFEAHRSANIRKAMLWDEAVLYGALSLFHGER